MRWVVELLSRELKRKLQHDGAMAITNAQSESLMRLARVSQSERIAVLGASIPQIAMRLKGAVYCLENLGFGERS